MTPHADEHGRAPHTVRLILQPYALGFPTLEPGGAAALRTAATLARRHGVRVQLSLFDGWRDYRRIEDSRAWLAQVLDEVGQDDLELIELQHMIDLARPHAATWVTAMIAATARLAPGVPVVLSAALCAPGHVLTALDDRPPALAR